MAVAVDKRKETPGVQSLETGLHLFREFMQGEHPCGLSELARRVGMHRAKAYRYLVSLQRAGWVTQDAVGKGYMPGPAARELALGWLQRQDRLSPASDAARSLCLAQGLTCFVALWGPAGATVVRVFQPPRTVAISVAEGAALPSDTSATGRLFAVWRGEWRGVLSPAEEVRIRQRGFSVVRGKHVAGVDAVAAPVLDQQRQIMLVLTLVGPATTVDVKSDGPHVRALQAACAALSLAPAAH